MQRKLSLPQIPGSAPKPSPVVSPVGLTIEPKMVPSNRQTKPGLQLTEEEKQDLKMNSKINGKLYVPFEPKGIFKLMPFTNVSHVFYIPKIKCIGAASEKLN